MTLANPILEKNLAVLRKRGQVHLVDTLASFAISDRVEASLARNGQPTLKLNGQAIHSVYNPDREASTLAEKLFSGLDPEKPVVLVGGGFGYIVQHAKNRLKNARIVLVEPVPDVLAMIVHTSDVTELLTACEVASGKTIPALVESVRSILGDDAKDAQIVVLPASREAAPHEVDAFVRAMQPNEATGSHTGNLRILLVGPVYGGSLPITGYVHNALKKLGHTVEWLDFSPLHSSVQFFDGLTSDSGHRIALQGQYTHLMAQAVLARAQVFQPQIVFFMAQSPGTPDVLNELRKAGIPTAIWFVEDGQLFDYGVKMAPHYDVFFHIQDDSFADRLANAGARHIHYLPLAADPDVHRPLELTSEEKAEFGSDLSHVGAGYPNRRKFFPALLDYDFKLWGSDWDQPGPLGRILQRNGARVSTEDSVKIFNASRINLNLHSATHIDGVNPDGDFINPRTFELAACGAFQLVDQRLLLNRVFTHGKEIITFSNLRDCREKIDYYLNHPDEAKTVAEAARKVVLTQHTYVHRMREAIGMILDTCHVPESRVKENTVAALVEEAGDDVELVNLFKRMGQPEDELTLQNLAERIRHEEGELNETEAIFLLMDEFHSWAKEKGVV
ncbi:MAG: glycosyltransferase [bacterium]